MTSLQTLLRDQRKGLESRPPPRAVCKEGAEGLLTTAGQTSFCPHGQRHAEGSYVPYSCACVHMCVCMCPCTMHACHEVGGAVTVSLVSTITDGSLWHCEAEGQVPALCHCSLWWRVTGLFPKLHFAEFLKDNCHGWGGQVWVSTLQATPMPPRAILPLDLLGSRKEGCRSTAAPRAPSGLRLTALGSATGSPKCWVLVWVGVLCQGPPGWPTCTSILP